MLMCPWLRKYLILWKYYCPYIYDVHAMHCTDMHSRSLVIAVYLTHPPCFVLSISTTLTKLGAGGWSPLDTDRYQWLQVDLGSRKQVVAIETQGRYSSSDWTSKYRVLYSDTQNNWRPYLQDGNIKVSKKTFKMQLTFSSDSDGFGVHK